MPSSTFHLVSLPIIANCAPTCETLLREILGEVELIEQLTGAGEEGDGSAVLVLCRLGMFLKNGNARCVPETGKLISGYEACFITLL